MAVVSQGAGRNVSCPDCGNEMIIPKAGIRWHCPSCSDEMEAPTHLKGQSVRCIECQQDTLVPNHIQFLITEHLEKPGLWQRRCKNCRYLNHRLSLFCSSCGYDSLGIRLFLRAHPVLFMIIAGGLAIAAAHLVLRQFDIPVVDMTPSLDRAAQMVQTVVQPRTAPSAPSRPPAGGAPENTAADWLKQYRMELYAGHYSNALIMYDSLRQNFSGAAQFQAFLHPALSNRWTHLFVASPCKACDDGRCSRCEGKGQCNTCEGRAVCSACKGNGTMEKKCTACLCSRCSGEGTCPTCRGMTKVNCSTCRGTGSGTQTSIQKPCSRCRGSGRIQLIKGQGACPVCGGSGSLKDTAILPCAKCGGKGALTCSTCGGKGGCSVCNGRGRLACAICEGDGVYDSTCERCNGNKVCPACSGKGTCPACKGDGRCPNCDGKTVLIQNSFPLDAAWLRQPQGYALFGGPSNTIIAQSSRMGTLTLTNFGHILHLTIASNEVFCISETAADSRVVRRMLK